MRIVKPLIFFSCLAGMSGLLSAQSGETITYTPTDDAQVKATSPSKNYGDKASAKVESNLYHTFLKFEVADLPQQIDAVRLRLFAVAASDQAGSVHLVANEHAGTDSSWSETTLVWENAPELTPALNTVGHVEAGTFVEFDITAAVAGDSIYSFALSSSSSDQVEYSTKEGQEPPVLIVLSGFDELPNTPPDANNDHYILSSGASLEVAAPGILTNDEDADGDSLTVTLDSGPDDGTLILNPDGSFMYTPDSTFLGSVEFTYAVDDGRGGSDIAAVKITVSGNGDDRAEIIEPVVSTSPTQGSADDPAIWIHPTQPERSIIVGTDKGGTLFVWDMQGNELQRLPQGTDLNNVDARQSVHIGGQETGIVVANLRDAGKVAVFKVNPDYTQGDALIPLADAASDSNDIQSNSYGICLYERPSDGALFVFERPKNDGALRQYRLTINAGGDTVRVRPVRDLVYEGSTAEGFVADDELGFVYITEEGEGIHKYYADPDMPAEAIAFFAAEDGIESDREGVAIYECAEGAGYLLLSSQGNSTVKIYERQGENKFLKTIIPASNDGSLSLGADGLDITSAAVAPAFPNGFVVVHDESGSRFHIYDWTEIAGDELELCPNGDRPPEETNLPPVAQNDSVTTEVNTPVEIEVTANDHDPDGLLDSTSVEIIQQPVYGIATVLPGSGLIRYVPNPTFIGVDELHYHVSDHDSTRSNPASVFITVEDNRPKVVTVSFLPTDDAHVQLTRPVASVGAETELRVDFPIFHSFLKFKIDQLAGEVEQARIRMLVHNSSDDGGSLYLVSNNYRGTDEPWQEDGLHFLNAPAIKGTALHEARWVGAGDTVEFDVTPVIRDKGSVSFGLLSRSNNMAVYSSKEGAFPPTLIVRAATPPIGPNLPPVAADDSVSTHVGETIDIAVLANDRDPDGSLAPETLRIEMAPKFGTVRVHSAGHVTYAPVDSAAVFDSFTYRVQDDVGAISNTATVTVTISDSLAGRVQQSKRPGTPLNASAQIPQDFELSPNYPNPFNLETRLSYALPEASHVRLIIFNTRGQQVRVLVDELQQPGYKHVIWNGRDRYGGEVASGIYFIRLLAGEQKLTGTMILQK